jgi:methylenetetrahydrofolate dehydrogenase (NADP+)/methenyltetrahydrofolate cyclohydrolase
MTTPPFFARAASLGLPLPRVPEDVAQRTISGTTTRALDGRYVSEALVAGCARLAADAPARGLRVPRLVVVLAGDDAASAVYVANKERTFAKAGFASETLRVPSPEASEERLLDIVRSLNARTEVDGILVQLPLPSGVSSARVLCAIDPRKDVDGFLKENMGLLALGEFTGALPCTPYGVMVLLAAYGLSARGKRAVVVGRSNIVGKPMGLLLLSEDATVTTAHSRTTDLVAHTRDADIVVAAAGQAKLIGRQHVKEGAIVVDVGMHRGSDGKLCGDVDASSETGVAGRAAWLTPVPGGVGPMTIAMLLVNTAVAAWGRAGDGNR